MARWVRIRVNNDTTSKDTTFCQEKTRKRKEKPDAQVNRRRKVIPTDIRHVGQTSDRIDQPQGSLLDLSRPLCDW